MLFQNKFFRNAIVGTLVLLFGFTTVFNIFSQNTVKVGQFNIKIVDIASLGGLRKSKDDKHYQNAIRTMIMFKLFSKEAKNLGIVINEADIKNYLQKTFSTDGRFDPKKLNDFMLNNQFSKNGLRIIAELELLKKQIAGLLQLGMPKQTEHAKILLEKLNIIRSGYYIVIDEKAVDVKKYGAPQGDDLFEFLINSEKMIDGQTCEVIKIGQDTNQYSFDDLKTKFTCVECAIVKGIINEFNIPINEMEIDDSTYLSKPFINRNGERVQVKFKELFGLNRNDVEKAWYHSDGAKARACFSIMDYLEKLLKEPEKVFSKNLPSGVSFTKVENVSFADCFQKRCSRCPEGGKCDKCLCNDCICNNCFNKKNCNKLSRSAAMMMIFTPLKELNSYKGEEGYYLVYPNGESVTKITENEYKRAEEHITNSLRQSAELSLFEEIYYRNTVRI